MTDHYEMQPPSVPLEPGGTLGVYMQRLRMIDNATRLAEIDRQLRQIDAVLEDIEVKRDELITERERLLGITP